MNLVANLQGLPMNDFSGGMTDFYVEAPLNRYELADNCLITPNKKLTLRPGSLLLYPNTPQTPAGNQRVATYINYDHDAFLIQGVGVSLYYVNTIFHTLLGPTGNEPFNQGDNNSLVASAQWNRHVIVSNDAFANPQKIYRDSAGALQIRTAGLPAVEPVPTVTTPDPGTVVEYIYLFIFTVNYLVDSTQFLTAGPTRQVIVKAATAPDVSPIVVSDIPVLDNGVINNWDTANVVVEIYRTKDAGTQFFKVGQVANGTTTFTDSMSDDTLGNQQEAYTNGGVLDNDPPPPCKYVHIANSSCYYAHIKEDGEIIPNRVRQSKPGIIDAAPGASFIDVEEDVVGISSVRGFVVVLCKKAIYRLDGAFDALGQGSIVYTKINDTAGCVSNKSIVQTVDGIYWAGNDGFYYSDAYRVYKISNNFNNTYKSLISTDQQKKNITGAYEELNRRVWWAVQKDGSSLDNDACFILDLRWGITEESTFTTASGGESFNPTSIIFFNKQFVRGDKHGYTIVHDEAILTDPRVDPFKLTSLWGTRTIIWDFKSASTNFGDSKNRKWVPRIVTALKNDSNISLQIYSNNDDGRQILPLSPIRFRGNILWGDPGITWGDDSILWNKTGLIDSLRKFPASSLRCSYKQVRLTNAFVNVLNSDQYGTVTVTRPPISPATDNLRTVTLDDTTFVFDVTDIDYYVSFETDNYTNNYQVVDFTTDTLTIVDPSGTAPIAPNLKWTLRGYPKGEVFDLLSITLLYAATSPSQPHATTTAAADGAPAT